MFFDVWCVCRCVWWLKIFVLDVYRWLTIWRRITTKHQETLQTHSKTNMRTTRTMERFLMFFGLSTVGPPWVQTGGSQPYARRPRGEESANGRRSGGSKSFEKAPQGEGGRRDVFEGVLCDLFALCWVGLFLFWLWDGFGWLLVWAGQRFVSFCSFVLIANLFVIIID